MTDVSADLGQTKNLARERYFRASEAGQGRAKPGRGLQDNVREDMVVEHDQRCVLSRLTPVPQKAALRRSHQGVIGKSL